MADADRMPIQVDQAMARIREKIHRQREVLQKTPNTEAIGPMQRALSLAHKHAQVGLSLPPMHRQSGVQRMLAIPLGKLFLRFAQLVTRDQRTFNEAIIDASRALDEQIQNVGRKLDNAVARLESLETDLTPQRQGLTLGSQLAQFRVEHEALAQQSADVRAERQQAADQSQSSNEQTPEHRG